MTREDTNLYLLSQKKKLRGFYGIDILEKFSKNFYIFKTMQPDDYDDYEEPANEGGDYSILNSFFSSITPLYEFSEETEEKLVRAMRELGYNSKHVLKLAKQGQFGEFKKKIQSKKTKQTPNKPQPPPQPPQDLSTSNELSLDNNDNTDTTNNNHFLQLDPNDDKIQILIQHLKCGHHPYLYSSFLMKQKPCIAVSYFGELSNFLPKYTIINQTSQFPG